MAELTKFFASNELYEAWKDNKEVPSNVIAVVLDETGEDVQKVAIGTNNIDGQYKTYEVAKGEEPTGTISITSNGSVDVAQYATANVKIPTVTTTEPYMLTTQNSDEYTIPYRTRPITLNEGDYVLEGDIITYTVVIDFTTTVADDENLAIIVKQVNNILPITVERIGTSSTGFTLTVSYDIVTSSYIDLYYYVMSNNYKLCTIGID